jgi:hypothetical protein
VGHIEMTKTQNKKWWEQTAPAYSIVNAIADVLDLEEEMEPAVLEQVASAMADTFEFTEEERAEVMKAALINQSGHVSDDEKED